MDDALLRAYLETDYQVRLPGGRRISLRIGQPLASALVELIGTAPWGLVTAWNPRSQPRAIQGNRSAQHELLAALTRIPQTRQVLAAVGIGSSGWRERSLLVVGPDTGMFDDLCRGFDQHAYVHGDSAGIVLLRQL